MILRHCLFGEGRFGGCRNASFHTQAFYTEPWSFGNFLLPASYLILRELIYICREKLSTMSVKEINPVPKVNNDTGFSTTGVINGSRFINRDGTFNLIKKDGPFGNASAFFTLCFPCRYGNS